MSAEGFYCPKCGAAAEADDLFCRKCGSALADNSSQVLAEGKERRWFAPWRSRSKKTVIGVVALLVLLFAGAAIAVATILTQGASKEDSEAAKQAELQARLQGPFSEAMRHRDSLFLAERGFIGAMADANGSLFKYQRRLKEVNAESQRINDANQAQESLCETYTDVPCPSYDYPNSPEVPDLAGAVKKLRKAATQMNQLHAQLLAIAPPQELQPFYAQLTAASEALSDVATHNADVLTEGVSTSGGEGASGFVDDDKIKTLRGNSAIPAIREMNRMALNLIRVLDLSVQDFDVPGGHDLDPTDHSTSR